MRHAAEPGAGAAVPLPEATKALLSPSQNAPGERTIAGPEQGRAGHHAGRTATATAEDPSA